jgi:hypothetical protein
MTGKPIRPFPWSIVTMAAVLGASWGAADVPLWIMASVGVGIAAVALGLWGLEIDRAIREHEARRIDRLNRAILSTRTKP